MRFLAVGFRVPTCHFSQSDLCTDFTETRVESSGILRMDREFRRELDRRGTVDLENGGTK